MHVVVRNIGQRIVASAGTVITVLAIRDEAVLFGIETVTAAQPQEAAAMSVHAGTAARRLPDD